MFKVIIFILLLSLPATAKDYLPPFTGDSDFDYLLERKLINDNEELEEEIQNIREENENLRDDYDWSIGNE